MVFLERTNEHVALVNELLLTGNVIDIQVKVKFVGDALESGILSAKMYGKLTGINTRKKTIEWTRDGNEMEPVSMEHVVII